MASMSATRPRPLHNFILPPLRCTTANRSSGSNRNNNNNNQRHCFDGGREQRSSSSPLLLLHSQFRFCERIKNGAGIQESSRVFDAELGRAAVDKNFVAENAGGGGFVRFGTSIDGSEEEFEVCGSRQVGELKHVVQLRKREKHAAKIDECPMNAVDSAVKHDEFGICDDSAAKKWNLRPRRENSLFKRWRHEGKNAEKRETFPRLVTSLSKEEIIADFVVFTGSKPPKKPTRKPASVQRDLNSMYPGSQLGAITADRYRVKEARRR